MSHTSRISNHQPSHYMDQCISVSVVMCRREREVDRGKGRDRKGGGETWVGWKVRGEGE